MSFTEGSSNKNDAVDVPYHIRDIKGVCIYMGPEEGPVSVYFRSLRAHFIAVFAKDAWTKGLCLCVR